MRLALKALVALGCFASVGRAAEPAASPPTKSLPNPTIDASVTEWVVFVADSANPELNARNLFHDHLPSFIEDLRTARSAGKESSAEPAPIGLIRFSAEGPIQKDVVVDVQLGYKNGRALGHWPRAKVRSGGLLWQDLRLVPDHAAPDHAAPDHAAPDHAAPDHAAPNHAAPNHAAPNQAAPDQAAPRKLPEGSWLSGLRSGGLPVVSGSTPESFLLYDVELPYPLTMQVTAGKEGKLSVAHGMDAPLLDLTFYKRGTDDHWQTAMLPSLAKAAGFPTAPAPAPAATPVAANTTGTFTIVNAARQLVAGTVTAARPAQATASNPATTSAPTKSIKGTDFTLGSPAESDATVLVPWRAKLAEAGVSAGDQEVVLKILARYALDPKRLTAVYRMDPKELDRILPLEVVPQPKKVSRIALVIVTGIDPSIGEELDRLIAKLGDSSWKSREAATAEIKKMGTRAKSRLEEAAKNKDTEIAYRAEQLLSGVLGSDDDQHRAAYFGAGGAP